MGSVFDAVSHLQDKSQESAGDKCLESGESIISRKGLPAIARAAIDMGNGKSGVDSHRPQSFHTSDPMSPRPIDPSLLFGMERTFYSAINVGTLVIFFGFGLMMIDTSDAHRFFAQGCIIVVAGLVYIGCSWLTHCSRMRMLSRGQKVTIRNSAVWTGCLACLLCVCIALELYYSYKYPYMERSTPVDVNVMSTTVAP